MKTAEKIILVLSLLILIAGLGWSLKNWLADRETGDFYGVDYRKALNAQNAVNPCLAPSGYTEEEWKEHMGHHPEQYRECL